MMSNTNWKLTSDDLTMEIGRKKKTRKKTKKTSAAVCPSYFHISPKSFPTLPVIVTTTHIYTQ